MKSRRACRLLAGLALLLPAAGWAAPPGPSHGPDLKLLRGRFAVRARWKTAGAEAVATPVPITDSAGYFWFFNPVNAEVMVKVIDACGTPQPRFWFFAAGLTDVQVTLDVTDLATGAARSYQSAQGHAFTPVEDTGAFATCGTATSSCGLGTAAEIAATPRPGDPTTELLALFLDGGFVADAPVYERAKADLAAIASQQPTVVPIDTWANESHGQMTLEVSVPTYQQIKGGTYAAWDCLNAWYRAIETQPYYLDVDRGFVSVAFRGVFDLHQIVPGYAALPGVLAAYPNGVFVVSALPPLRLSCALAQGDTYHYFVPTSVGNPLRLFYFTSHTGEAPQLQGVAESGEQPAWKALADACFGAYVLIPPA